MNLSSRCSSIFYCPTFTALLTRSPGRIGSHTKKRHTLRCAFNLISEFSCTVLPSRILGVRRCGWPYVATLHVHLTLRTKRCSESVVASLPHLLLPCFYCPAHQVPWEDRKPYNKKRHTLRCAFKQSAASYPSRPSPAKYFRRL